MKLAERLEDRDLALHFALCLWHAASSASARRVVVEASIRRKALAEPAYRVAYMQETVEDWDAISHADPYTSWPQIEALGSAGEHGAHSLETLSAAGRVRALGDKPLAWRIRDARVTRNRQSVAVGSAAPERRDRWHLVPELGAFDCSAALRWSDQPPTRHTRGALGIVGERFPYSGYYHWLVGGLRDVLMFDACDVLRELDRVLVCVPNVPAPSYLRASLEAIGLDASRFEICADGFDVTVDEVVRPQEGAWLLSEYVPRIRDRLGLPRRRAERRRLLISRRDAAKRRVSNEAELETVLRTHGFELVVPGSLEFAAQVEAFASAEVIVAPHGAALSNVMFAEPGTPVIELHHDERYVPWFRRIARAANLAYFSLPCRANPDAPRDLVVDVDRVTTMVKDVLPTP